MDSGFYEEVHTSCMCVSGDICTKTHLHYLALREMQDNPIFHETIHP